MFTMNGRIKVIKPEQQVSEKFKKRDFVVIDESSPYTQFISFQMTQDRCASLEQFNEGDQVNVHFLLKGREWTAPDGEVKYFNTLEAWRVEPFQAMQQPQQPMGAPAQQPMGAPQQPAAQPAEPQGGGFADGGSDDLPF